MTPQIPVDEASRLAALHATSLFGTGPEEAFDRITRLTAKLLDVPTALISLVGSDTQWFKSRCGFAAQYTSRDVSFCGHAILTDQPLVVPDASRDPRFADNPIVLGEPHVRFYAGVQLYSVERAKLGTLCILDTKPREIGEAELEEMHELARMVEELIYHRQLARAAQQLHEQLQSRGSGTQLAAAAGQVEFLLTHDTLTGLANRQALLHAARPHARVARHQRHGTPPRLPEHRPLQAHQRGARPPGRRRRAGGGDARAGSRTRPGDMLARTGNDEFALLIGTPGTPAELETRLNRLMHEVNHSVSWSGKEVAITCSIGFARFPGMATMPTACSAMRPPRCAMQKPGRRAHRAFLAWPAPELGRRMALESQLRRALERGELFLQYQPKIDLQRGWLAGFEALLRWRHPEYGVVSPEEFVPIAEETGLIVPIGEWIVGTAIAQMVAWRNAGLPEVPVAVNLSARQFLQGDVVAPGGGAAGHGRPARGPAGAGTDRKRVHGRTRAQPGHHAPPARPRGHAQHRRLRHRLLELRLPQAPADRQAQDRQIVCPRHGAQQRCARHRRRHRRHGHSLNLRVVAEGVEVAAQAAALRATGCDPGPGLPVCAPLGRGRCRPLSRRRAGAWRPFQACGGGINAFFGSVLLGQSYDGNNSSQISGTHAWALWISLCQRSLLRPRGLERCVWISEAL
ncbi:EAL domain-containing protein [Massilia sp. Dwa41.01b]|nr:EAL domain-containing protein [Massilia sp. Dwa41.01b]QNA90065.1 EAL domain-containing protein [Massilia sp. Dwa41.01b]